MKSRSIPMILSLAILTLLALGTGLSTAAGNGSAERAAEDPAAPSPVAPDAPAPLCDVLPGAQVPVQISTSSCDTLDPAEADCECFTEDDLVPCRCVSDDFCPDACVDGSQINYCSNFGGPCMCTI